MIQIIDKDNDMLVAEVEGSDVAAFLFALRVCAIIGRDEGRNAMCYDVIMPPGHTVPTL